MDGQARDGVGGVTDDAADVAEADLEMMVVCEHMTRLLRDRGGGDGDDRETHDFLDRVATLAEASANAISALKGELDEVRGELDMRRQLDAWGADGESPDHAGGGGGGE